MVEEEGLCILGHVQGSLHIRILRLHQHRLHVKHPSLRMQARMQTAIDDSIQHVCVARGAKQASQSLDGTSPEYLRPASPVPLPNLHSI